jgi:hypothetical protein
LIDDGNQVPHNANLDIGLNKSDFVLCTCDLQSRIIVTVVALFLFCFIGSQAKARAKKKKSMYKILLFLSIFY